MEQDKRIFLVDTENAQGIWMSVFSRLEEEDELYIFYSDKSDNEIRIKLSDLNSFLQTAERAQAICCFNGRPHSLDFQLTSYLGYLISQDEDTEYVILSDDEGFDCVCDFWQERGVSVKRQGIRTAGIPEKARSVIESSLKKEYRTKDNVKLLYDGIMAGRNEEIEKAVAAVANNDTDREALTRHFIAAAPSVRKGASEDSPSKVFTTSYVRFVNEIPPKSRVRLQSSMKKKYQKSANLVTAYNAILSGNSSKMFKAAQQIASDKKDAKAMHSLWMGYTQLFRQEAQDV